MTTGPGVYDVECTVVRERTRAAGVLLLVIEGDRGNGFSAQFTHPTLVGAIPQLLRQIADEMARDAEATALQEEDDE